MKVEESEGNEVLRYLRSGTKRMSDLAGGAHAYFLERNCHAYFKTIYIGYDLDGVMVAALYKRADHLEIALALPENHESPLLIDATHLTWRTLPLAAVIEKKAQLVMLRDLVAEACQRISTQDHNVHRDNEFFTRHKRHPMR